MGESSSKASNIVEYRDYLVQIGRVEVSLTNNKLSNFASKFWTIASVVVMIMTIVNSFQHGGGWREIIVVAVFTSPLFFIGKSLVDRNNRQKKYLELILDKGERSIKKLSEAIPISYDKALKDILKMINEGVLSGFDIVESSDPQKTEQSKDTAKAPKSSSKESVVICCGCGAKNVVEADEVGVCEFCEGPISLQK